MRRARLECHGGRLRGQRFALADEATIGRGLDNAVALDDEQISTHHARIWFDEDRDVYLLEDLGSLNGTEVDGVKVIHPEPLPGLHVITFAGELDFIFQRLPEEVAAADGEADAATAEPGAAPGPVLEVTLGRGEPLRFPLREGEQTIGRAEDADLRLDVEEVSRRHAQITVAGGRVLLADLGSSNHTFVDGRQIDAETELAPGARIRFGAIEARLLPPA